MGKLGDAPSALLAMLGLLLSAGFLATGCASSEPDTAPTHLGKVSTIEEVRDAFIAAGGVCNWNQNDVVLDATASGTCSDQTVIMLFADPADKTAVVARLGSLISTDLHLLVGENWIINSKEAVELADKIGGKVVARTED